MHQFGRSMVEMLGVLAIIGVLSIGGLYAYRYAMTRHQSNIVIEDIKFAGFVVKDEMFDTLPVGGVKQDLSERFKKQSTFSYYVQKESETTYAIVIPNVSKRLCVELKNSYGLAGRNSVKRAGKCLS